MLTYSWLSEASDIAIVLFRYIRKITDASRSIETNFADPDILTISKLGKKVADERYRILQFMRFQKTTEGIYYGAMEPLYDVFPLTIRHFRDRFADQKWLIYDVKSIIRKSKFPPNPERSVQFSGKRTKRSVQKKGCTQHL